MTEKAEANLLKARLDNIEDAVKDIERGVTRAEDKLRDRFAIAAMQALLPSWEISRDFDLCKRAWNTADAMIKARSK
jgi:hypothetical protein